jgi:hypothetical protein
MSASLESLQRKKHWVFAAGNDIKVKAGFMINLMNERIFHRQLRIQARKR